MVVNGIKCFQVKKLRGLSWDVAAVGNAKWTGVRLCDLLKDLGINEDAFSHVQVNFDTLISNFYNITIKYSFSGIIYFM